MALAKGEDVPSGLVNQHRQRQKKVPSVILDPVAVTKDNVKDTIVKDGFWKAIADLHGQVRQRLQEAPARRSGGEVAGRPAPSERKERPTAIGPARLKGVSKRFGAVQALDGVDFEVHAGEVVALVGDNGAGKSTLVKTIAGIYRPTTGEFSFEGEPVTISGPTTRSLGIATVYQDLALCDNLDVVANLFLGREEIGSGGPARSSTRPRWSTARTSCSSSSR